MRFHSGAALLSAIVLLSGARFAHADVTLVSRLTVTTQAPPELVEKAKSGTEVRTLRTYYKGLWQRQEVSQGKEIVIIDLAANKRITLNPASKTYFVVPLQEKKPVPAPANSPADPNDESLKSAVTLAADLQPGNGGTKVIAGKTASSYVYNITFGLDMDKVLAKVKEDMAKEKEKAAKEKAATPDASAGEKAAAAGDGTPSDAKKDDSGAADFVIAMLSAIPNLSVKLDGEQWVTDTVNLPARWVSPTLFGAGAFAASSPIDEMPLPPSVPVDLKEFLAKVAAIRGLPLSGRTDFDITVRFTEQAIGNAKGSLPQGPIHVRVSLQNEAQSVTEAPLSETLFVVPKGYRKVAAPENHGDYPGLPRSMQ
jgi:hypothetical protein